MNQNKNIVFLHIPKNGGTTLNTILERLFNKNNIFNIEVINSKKLNTQDFINLPQSKKQNIKLLKGHMLFGLHKYLLGESTYITFLRKPEDRLLSYYNYVKNNPNHRFYKQVCGNNLSFYEFIDNINEGDLHNAQVRYISGIKHGTHEELLKGALRNIENHFSFVGLLEYYDLSILLLNKIFNWNISFYQKKNKGKYIKRIDKKTLDLIAKKNKADLELYKIVEHNLIKEIKKRPLIKLQLFIFRTTSKLKNSYKLKRIAKFFDTK